MLYEAAVWLSPLMFVVVPAFIGLTTFLVLRWDSL